MSNFKFKLQKLLDIRVNEEEESKLFYSKAQNQKNIVENKLHELENNYKKYFFLIANKKQRLNCAL